MDHEGAASGFGLHIVNENLIVPVARELDDESLQRLQREILEKAQATSVTGVLIDVSAVRVLDSFAFSALADTARMLSLLGSRPVFVGFQAGVASALVDLDVDLDRIVTALTMEDGLELLRSLSPRWKRSAEPDEEEPESEAGNDEIIDHDGELDDEGDHDR